MALKIDVESLNETILNDVSIDELESRLQSEELNIRTEMWTTCSCNVECPSNCPCHGQLCYNAGCTATCPPNCNSIHYV